MTPLARCPPRVALLSPYWDFFAAKVPFDLRADRRALLERISAILSRSGVEIGHRQLIDSPAAAREAAARAAAAEVDTLVILQSMAVPPGFALAAIEALPDVALVILVMGRSSRVDDDFSHTEITAEGGTVGGPQLTNVLARRARRHVTAVAALDTLDGAASALAGLRAPIVAAAAAGRLRRARVARVGRPIDGYECVDCDPQALRRATGIELVDVAPGLVRDAYLAASTARAAAIERETRATFALAEDIEADRCLERSVLFAAALEAIDDDHGFAAGAMNCHVPEIRLAADDPGIAPCFALGRETSRGIPWSCTGDVVTAVALLTTKALGASALYHEIEALDHETGEAVLANSGEHDLTFADPAEPPALVRNGWWSTNARCSACARFAPAPGPASLVAFTPHGDEPSGFRFVVAEGSFTARRLPHTGTAHALFRFAGADPVAHAWSRWAAAGVNHHSSATPGHIGNLVADVAAHLGIGFVQVS